MLDFEIVVNNMGQVPVLLLVVNLSGENKKFVDITQQCFDLLPLVNFLAKNFDFY